MVGLSYSNEEFLGHELRLQGYDQSFAGTYGGGTYGTFQDPAFGADLYDQSQNNSDKRGFKLTLALDEPGELPLGLVYGMDYLSDDTFQQLVLTGRNWVPESSYENYSWFAQTDYSGIENLTVTIGVRLEYDNNVISAQLSYYTSDSDLGQRLQANADGIYSVQRERTEIDGFEFRAQWLASSEDTLGLRYAHTDGQYDADDDGSVDTDLSGANMSPSRLNLSWDRNWSNALMTRLQVNVLHDRDFNNAAGVTTSNFDGYTTVDLYGEYQLNNSAIRLGLQNLTNTDYFTYYSQTLGNNGRNFKGIGRSFSLSYSLNF
jgi:outer membrane receptor for ferrienterochelin and colicin